MQTQLKRISISIPTEYLNAVNEWQDKIRERNKKKSENFCKFTWKFTRYLRSLNSNYFKQLRFLQFWINQRVFLSILSLLATQLGAAWAIKAQLVEGLIRNW